MDVDALVFRSAASPPEPADLALSETGEPEVRVHTASLLRIKDAALAIEQRCARLERALERRNGELRRVREEMAEARRDTQAARLDTIDRLLAATDCRDHETAAHTERIGLYSEILARALSLPPEQVATIRSAAPMHDVGKLGVPDAILMKTSRLTPAERAVMRQHTVIGARMLKGSPSPLMRTGASIALAHHERWDGTGYPYGVSAKDIPLEARICSVADVYDALSSDRRYREALPQDTVLEMMESQRGRQFDPRVLDAFLSCHAEIEAIPAKA